MESIYSQQLLEADRFPWGTIDKILSLGLVQKDGFEYPKGSVDRCLGLDVDEVEGKQTLLTEYKCRVSIDQARDEEDQIEGLRLLGRMSDESNFCEVKSDDPERFEFIHDEEELAQVLHHAFIFEKDTCLHVVGNTRELLSCTQMCFTPDLLEMYQNALVLL